MRTCPLVSFMKKKIEKNTWLSLFLLLLVNINLGWVLSQSGAGLLGWLLTIASILLIAEVVASPWELIKNVTTRWLQSHTRAFIGVILSAFCAVLILTWFHISAHLLLLIVATSIGRIDLQETDYQNIQAFLILAILSVSGLCIGWTMYRAYTLLLQF
ncbi:MAG: hypothetical protein F6J93_37585 [Oscillatoria sp. SIO1A7]|nr:hypothetical protein [Oscillatoria sp. SIO1A7]